MSLDMKNTNKGFFSSSLSYQTISNVVYYEFVSQCCLLICCAFVSWKSEFIQSLNQRHFMLGNLISSVFLFHNIHNCLCEHWTFLFNFLWSASAPGECNLILVKHNVNYVFWTGHAFSSILRIICLPLTLTWLAEDENKDKIYKKRATHRVNTFIGLCVCGRLGSYKMCLLYERSEKATTNDEVNNDDDDDDD